MNPKRPFDDSPTVELAEAGAAGGTPSGPRRAAAEPFRPGVGDVLKSRFRLVKLIGEGGTSRVFQALDLRRQEAGSTDPYVAVKVLTHPLDEYFGSPSALQAEAQKLQSLAHPNIVRVFDCDRDGETVFMTMEYLDGGTLLEGTPAGDARTVIRAIASGLGYAHRQRIVHGDLKPGNVMISPQGQVKLVDFGIARWLAREEAPKGKPPAQRAFVPAASTPYASPEVLARQIPEIADDVYSLAVIAYRLLTGRHPFEGGAANSGSIRRRRPAKLPGLKQAEYVAIVNAMRPERRTRTASVPLFMEQFTDAGLAHRMIPVPWIVAIGLVVVAVGVAWYYDNYGAKVQGHTPPAAAGAVAPAGAGAPLIAGTVVRDCPGCPALTVVPRGEFWQGSDPGLGTPAFEQPRHFVRIAYPLAMSTHEVTVGEFRDFVGATGRAMPGCEIYDGTWRLSPAASWENPGFAQGDNQPVACTSWNDATAYAQWLTSRTGHRYRLPSASEWEYAARAGSPSAEPWGPGGADACQHANLADETAAAHFSGWQVFGCRDGYIFTAPVGSFKANAFGLDDLFGNVFEWTQDCWHPDYTGAPSDGRPRLEAPCGEHELRGGSWFSAPLAVSAAYRNHFPADYRASSVGFRVVREAAP